MQIKRSVRKGNEWAGFATIAVVVLLLSVAGLPRLGRSSPIPGISAVMSNDNATLWLTVTNGVTNEFYTIYSKLALDDNIPWSGSITGMFGQTNFAVIVAPGLSGFFKAESGTDRDGDNVPNFQDADQNNAAVGILTITITAPANGSTIQ